MLFRFALFLLFGWLSFSSPALAEAYATPTWGNLLRTMIRFNALKLDDPLIVDDFSVVTECDLYKAFYHNDFKWNQVRQTVLKSAQQYVATFPMNYHYDVTLRLDRYDFATRTFRFTDGSAMRNVNTFMLYSVIGNNCGNADVKYVPRSFRAVLSAPLYLEGLPLSELDAKELLHKMEAEHNDNRVIFARINLRIVYIENLHKITARQFGVDTIRYMQSETYPPGLARFDAQLDSIDFYQDQERTRLVYHFQE